MNTMGKQADERDEYNRQIQATERVLDDLRAEQREVQDAFDDLGQVGEREWSRLLALDEELSSRGAGFAPNKSDELTREFHHFRKLLSDEQDTLAEDLARARSAQEDEREQLQQERDELPWD